VEVVVIGKNVFAQISSSLKPLQHLLAKTMKRRATSTWQRLPIAYEILEREPLSSFIEPLPSGHLRPESTLEQAMTLFNENTSSFHCVVDEQQCLQGIVTRTDLFCASELGAHRHTAVRDFMVAPIAVTKNDSSLMAAATMRDHELKSLPVIESQTSRRLVGYVRAEKMFMRVLQKLPVDFRLYPSAILTREIVTIQLKNENSENFSRFNAI
jgi:CBS-domain-containing membrane protein